MTEFDENGIYFILSGDEIGSTLMKWNPKFNFSARIATLIIDEYVTEKSDNFMLLSDEECIKLITEQFPENIEIYRERGDIKYIILKESFIIESEIYKYIGKKFILGKLTLFDTETDLCTT